ncbi:NADPH-dependent FMN reductase [Granulosicoccus antarcticus]|uniref:Chromate reductase n=1 Tax=Granulosicoccus antarcticus IMCC3135 TaxID=1192854 RepID=A0A2Z2P355_9GAMM|nr:NADPH-dependent FMN reductase [Granulosicoccus antarcticus]ASJ75830.1 Chromate reductase [Granulosicoccus antarcticus IMCC3135]
MKILAISGSLREVSSNSLLLRILGNHTPENWSFSLYEDLGSLPIFNPDLEDELTPEAVQSFCHEVAQADAVIISCPEYVRAIPGGLKNSIDWLVSRDEIISKPIALVHASHRGDDMLASLRMVLATVSERFATDIFLRIPLNSMSLEQAESELAQQENIARMIEFLWRLEAFSQAGS